MNAPKRKRRAPPRTVAELAERMFSAAVGPAPACVEEAGKEGPPMAEDKSTSDENAPVAHHEAGHSVANYFFGMLDDIDEVNIAARGDAAGENRGQYPPGESPSIQEIERLVMTLFAGHAAEICFDPSRAEQARQAALQDDSSADDELERIWADGQERAKRARFLRLKAASLIEEHWDAVAALATELMNRERLSRDEASWVVAIAEGKAAERALAEWRASRDDDP